ncbi:hypothetical protein PABG_12209 [Paracoccidioides brasiliensis Pb03]|nr:hypothetical protein PABG_12209 [Paracoccidioides brasiliensis Pb03]
MGQNRLCHTKTVPSSAKPLPTLESACPRPLSASCTRATPSVLDRSPNNGSIFPCFRELVSERGIFERNNLVAIGTSLLLDRPAFHYPIFGRVTDEQNIILDLELPLSTEMRSTTAAIRTAFYSVDPLEIDSAYVNAWLPGFLNIDLGK